MKLFNVLGNNVLVEGNSDCFYRGSGLVLLSPVEYIGNTRSNPFADVKLAFVKGLARSSANPWQQALLNCGYQRAARSIVPLLTDC